jgi:hypothetical protein
MWTIPGRIICLSKGPMHRLRLSNSTLSSTPPALVGSRLYIRDRCIMIAVDLS